MKPQTGGALFENDAPAGLATAGTSRLRRLFTAGLPEPNRLTNGALVCWKTGTGQRLLGRYGSAGQIANQSLSIGRSRAPAVPMRIARYGPSLYLLLELLSAGRGSSMSPRRVFSAENMRPQIRWQPNEGVVSKTHQRCSVSVLSVLDWQRDRPVPDISEVVSVAGRSRLERWSPRTTWKAEDQCHRKNPGSYAL